MQEEKPRLISADSHVLEPGDLWLQHLPRSYAEVCPRVISTDKGDAFVFEDRKPWRLGVEFAATESNRSVAKGKSWSDAPSAGFESAARLDAQDRDGVECEVLYPSLGLYLWDGQPSEHRHAFFSAYNDWLSELCAGAPERLLGIAMIDVADITIAVKEIERVRELGLRGVMLPTVQDPPYYDDLYVPIWDAVAELHLPVSFHAGTGAKVFQHRGPGSGGMNVWRSQSNIVEPFIFLMWSGRFEKHPGLKIGLIEGGIEWLPGALAMVDDIHGQHEWIDAPLTRKPSEYWSSNCFATFERSTVGIKNVDAGNDGSVMWASDFPHAESTWPNSREVFEGMTTHLDDDAKNRIGADNCRRVYEMD